MSQKQAKARRKIGQNQQPINNRPPNQKGVNLQGSKQIACNHCGSIHFMKAYQAIALSHLANPTLPPDSIAWPEHTFCANQKCGQPFGSKPEEKGTEIIV